MQKDKNKSPWIATGTKRRALAKTWRKGSYFVVHVVRGPGLFRCADEETKRKAKLLFHATQFATIIGRLLIAKT
jgi:hypothetical protein